MVHYSGETKSDFAALYAFYSQQGKEVETPIPVMTDLGNKRLGLRCQFIQGMWCHNTGCYGAPCLLAETVLVKQDDGSAHAGKTGRARRFFTQTKQTDRCVPCIVTADELDSMLPEDAKKALEGNLCPHHRDLCIKYRAWDVDDLAMLRVLVRRRNDENR